MNPQSNFLFFQNLNMQAFYFFQQQVNLAQQLMMQQNMYHYFNYYLFFCNMYKLEYMNPNSFSLFLRYSNNIPINTTNNNTNFNSFQIPMPNYNNINEPIPILPRPDLSLPQNQNKNINIKNMYNNIDNNYNYDEEPSMINIIFQTSTGDKRIITVPSDKTISYLIKSYIKNLNLPLGTSIERINFLYNGYLLNSKSEEIVSHQFKDLKKITVFDSMDVTGA